MKFTIGIKLGSCFLLTLAVLILSSLYALNGVIGIRASLEEISGEAWQSADSAATLNLNVNQSTAQLRSYLAYQETIPTTAQQQIEQHLSAAYTALEQLNRSEFGVESENLNTTLDQLNQLKQTVIRQHSAYVADIESINAEYAQTGKFMQRLRFYGNYQVSSLEDAFQRNQVTSWSGDIEDKWEFVIGIYTAQVELGNTISALQRQLQSSNPAKEKEQVTDALNNLMDALKEISGSPLANRQINSGVWKGHTYTAAIDLIIQRHQATTDKVQRSQSAFLATRDKLLELTQTLQYQTRSLSDLIANKVAQETEHAVVRANNLSTTMITSLPVGILLTLIAIWLSYRMVITPVKKASHQMAEIASGEGDLSARLPVKGEDELAALAKNFNHFVTRIADTINQVSRSAGDVARTSDTLKNNATHTLSAVEIQNRDCDQAVTAMSEISSTVTEIASNAGEAAQCSDDALRSAAQSREIVDQNRKATQTLSSEILRATEVISQLADESSKVSNIIGVIQGIAEQTNLLALNAAIEAARAGDHGRGFSVVADEVRALSLNTQQATEEIRALLDSLQTRAGTAVNTMQKGRIMAQENVELSEQVYRLIETVSGDIDRINQLNLLIATATEEQAQVTHITRESLTNISQATTRTEDSARSNSDASRSLEQQSEQLREVLAQFKL